MVRPEREAVGRPLAGARPLCTRVVCDTPPAQDNPARSSDLAAADRVYLVVDQADPSAVRTTGEVCLLGKEVGSDFRRFALVVNLHRPELGGVREFQTYYGQGGVDCPVLTAVPHDPASYGAARRRGWPAACDLDLGSPRAVADPGPRRRPGHRRRARGGPEADPGTAEWWVERRLLERPSNAVAAPPWTLTRAERHCARPWPRGWRRRRAISPRPSRGSWRGGWLRVAAAVVDDPDVADMPLNGPWSVWGVGRGRLERVRASVVKPEEVWTLRAAGRGRPSGPSPWRRPPPW